MLKKITLIFIAILVVSCGHTNNLGKYVLRGKKAFYDVKVSYDARQIEVNVEEKTKEKKEEDKSDFEKFLEVGSDIVSAGKISTLQDYVDTETLVFNITANLEDALITFLDIHTVDRITDRPDFIVKIDLKRCALHISPSGSTVSLFVTADIIQRNSGEIIWANWETYTIPVGESSKIDGNMGSGTEHKIANAIQLLAMSKEEIQDYMNYLAEIVGERMSDTFREDYNESVKNKVYEN